MGKGTDKRARTVGTVDGQLSEFSTRREINHASREVRNPRLCNVHYLLTTRFVFGETLGRQIETDPRDMPPHVASEVAVERDVGDVGIDRAGAVCTLKIHATVLWSCLVAQTVALGEMLLVVGACLEFFL